MGLLAGCIIFFIRLLRWASHSTTIVLSSTIRIDISLRLPKLKKQKQEAIAKTYILSTQDQKRSKQNAVFQLPYYIAFLHSSPQTRINAYHHNCNCNILTHSNLLLLTVPRFASFWHRDLCRTISPPPSPSVHSFTVTTYQDVVLRLCQVYVAEGASSDRV